MTTIDTTPEPTENAFAAPEADLTDTSLDKPVLQFERFSAWGVFGLSFITLGIYAIYWLYSRSQVANSLSYVAKVNMTLMNAFIGTYILSFVFELIPVFSGGEASGALAMISGLLSIAYLILFLFVIFSLRKVIREIINIGSDEEVHLGGIKTFFFSTLYFQYKINEAIDNQSEKASSVVK